MKKFCLVLFGFFFLVLSADPGYCFLGGYVTKREILSWNKKNAHKVKIDLPASKVFSHFVEFDKVPGYPQYGKKKEFDSNNVCFSKGSITNNSDEIIRQIIIPFIVLSNSEEVYRENLLLNITVYPSATVKIDDCYNLPWIGDASELVSIKSQLGEAYGWNHDKIISIPDSEETPFKEYELEKILDIKIYEIAK